jgi:aminopeptidase N
LLHESAHEWWGNNVSCTDNAELWIHESFARYAEALYIEDHYGYKNSQRYLTRMKSLVANRRPVIGPRDINYIHHGDMDMYGKGALMLNTLRHVIGNDSTWFAILKGIQMEFRLKTVDTDDLVNYFSRSTGTDYTSFFNQYLRHADLPVLELAFEEQDGKSFVRYRWVAAVHDFTMPVQVKIEKEGILLHPTTEWQRLEHPIPSQEALEVNTDQYYVEVRVISPAG